MAVLMLREAVQKGFVTVGYDIRWADVSLGGGGSYAQDVNLFERCNGGLQMGNLKTGVSVIQGALTDMTLESTLR